MAVAPGVPVAVAPLRLLGTDDLAVLADHAGRHVLPDDGAAVAETELRGAVADDLAVVGVGALAVGLAVGSGRGLAGSGGDGGGGLGDRGNGLRGSLSDRRGGSGGGEEGGGRRAALGEGDARDRGGRRNLLGGRAGGRAGDGAGGRLGARGARRLAAAAAGALTLGLGQGPGGGVTSLEAVAGVGELQDLLALGKALRELTLGEDLRLGEGGGKEAGDGRETLGEGGEADVGDEDVGQLVESRGVVRAAGDGDRGAVHVHLGVLAGDREPGPGESDIAVGDGVGQLVLEGRGLVVQTGAATLDRVKHLEGGLGSRVLVGGDAELAGAAIVHSGASGAADLSDLLGVARVEVESVRLANGEGGALSDRVVLELARVLAGGERTAVLLQLGLVERDRVLHVHVGIRQRKGSQGGNAKVAELRGHCGCNDRIPSGETSGFGCK